MDPVTIGIAIAALVGPAVVALVALSIGKIIDWFKARRQISPQHKNAIGVVIAKRMNDHNYVEIPGVFGNRTAETELVQAIYDPDSDTVLKARAMRSGHVADQTLIRGTEDGDGMMIFT